jgi:polar amino acid transport system substrate-binding protein
MPGHPCCAAPWLALLVLVPWGVSPAARAQAPGKTAAPPLLRWGGDATGGEPYINERPGRQPAGFEGDLAAYLAKKLGARSEFVQGEWDKLPLFLRRKSIDLVLNGYEWTPQRAQAMLSTIPYYSYRLRLIVKKDGPIRDWDGLKAGMRVGVLKDSAAETYVRKQHPDVKVVGLGEEGSTGVMRMVAVGQLDATVQDDPVVSWYMNRKKAFPTLTVVGDAVAPSENPYYVIFVRKEESALRDRLDAALRDGLKDGTLRSIYSRYGLWSDEEKELLEAGQKLRTRQAGIETDGDTAESRLTWGRFLGDLGEGAAFTILLTLLAMPLAIVVGLLVALGRLYGPGWLRVPLVVYVEVIRGTPVLFQLMVLFFFLPAVTDNLISLPAFWAGVLGLAINYGAYEAENYRAGLLAIPRGQMEAALALGMSKGTALCRIVVPQAIRLVVPPVTNDFISLFKDTSICSAIAVTELMARYRTLTVNFPQMAVYTLVLTGCLYLLMSYPLSLMARRMERAREKGRVEG